MDERLGLAVILGVGWSAHEIQSGKHQGLVFGAGRRPVPPGAGLAVG